MKIFYFALTFLLASIVGANKPLLVANGFDCIFHIPEDLTDGQSVPPLISTTSNLVFIDGTSIIAKMTCKFDIPDDLHIPIALIGEDFDCTFDPGNPIPDRTTTNTRVVGTPGGTIIMFCLFDGSN
jgi:hypothetical protein